MADYQFSLIVPVQILPDDQVLNATDSLGNAGCTDASIRGHAEGMEVLFDRAADSLQSAITLAIADVEQAGYRVGRVEMQREAIQV